MNIRNAPFALRVSDRAGARRGIVYRRRPDDRGRDRLRRLAVLTPLAYGAAIPLLREAVRDSAGASAAPKLEPGPLIPLTEDWGARIACFAIISVGLRDVERLMAASAHLRAADGTEAAWWLGLLTGASGGRAARALRILTEAVR
jgi:hypothetical protein